MWIDRGGRLFLEPGEVALVAKELRQGCRLGAALRARDLLLEAIADNLARIAAADGILLGPACPSLRWRAALHLVRRIRVFRPARWVRPTWRPDPVMLLVPGATRRGGVRLTPIESGGRPPQSGPGGPRAETPETPPSS